MKFEKEYDLLLEENQLITEIRICECFSSEENYNELLNEISIRGIFDTIEQSEIAIRSGLKNISNLISPKEKISNKERMKDAIEVFTRLENNDKLIAKRDEDFIKQLLDDYNEAPSPELMNTITGKIEEVLDTATVNLVAQSAANEKEKLQSKSIISKRIDSIKKHGKRIIDILQSKGMLADKLMAIYLILNKDPIKLS
jgi:hypothetical protein